MRRAFFLSACVVLVGLPALALDPPRLELVSEKGRDATRDLDWEVEYYQLAGMADAGAQKEVNGSLRRMSLAAKRLMLMRLRTWEKPPGASGPNGLTVSMTLGLHTPELLSVSQSIDDYYAGTAHPNLTLRARTFDLKTGRRLFKKDVFRSGTDAELLARIDAKLRTLPEYQQDGEYILETPEIGDLKELMLEKGGVTFLFSPYLVGPYAAGPVVVTLSWKDLAGLTVADGPVGRLAGAGSGITAALPLGQN